MERHRLAVRVLVTLVLPALAVVLAAGVVRGAPGERIETVAGSGTGGFGGDGAPATSALLTSPSDVALLGGGAYLIADTSNHRIRRVDAAGIVTTAAGAGPAAGAAGSYGGDGLAPTATPVRLNQPRGVSALPGSGGGFLIADTGNHRIRQVDDGAISTVAGIGSPAYGGDNGPARSALLNQPGGVAALAGGGFLIADTGNNRIRRVDVRGIITTVAGTGPAAYTGDGGPATQAALNAPARVAPLAGGGFLIADTGNHRIRRVDADGTIRTVAGTGTAGFGGDGGPAGKASLNGPEGVAALADGSIAIADSTNERVRLVGPNGTIRTLAGSGTLGFSGDGGDPEGAQLSHPRAVTPDGTRTLVADSFNHRVRVVLGTPLATGPGDEPLTPTVPLGVSPPVLGKSVVAKPRLGRVLVRLPGTGRFVPLESISNLPMGAELDVGDGSVVLFFTTNGQGRRAKAIATGGNLILNQPAEYDRGQRPGELILSGRLHGCATQGTAVEPARAGLLARAASPGGPVARGSARAKQGRRLKVRARGRIRTRGRYGAATVRGTRWSTIDRCPEHVRPGTLVVVSKGKVAVRSFVLRRTVLVRAGNRYLAPARRG
jgi:NHL repeat